MDHLGASRASPELQSLLTATTRLLDDGLIDESSARFWAQGRGEVDAGVAANTGASGI